MGEEASLAHTPTWVVAAVCLAIVSVSLAAERFLHYLGKSLKRKDQKTLYSAVQRLKEELMLLGFISFLLSLSQGFIIHICIPETSTHFMLPCKKENLRAAEEGAKLCKRKGDVPLLSLEALHQLHIFIFVLGLVHVVFCATTILLGGAKIKKWKHWETGIHQEIQVKLRQAELERKDTPLNTLLHRNHQRKFVSDRTNGFWMKLAVVSWIIAFLNQFYDSVSKSDYEALRSAFVLIHYPKKPDFDFHKYMMRVLEHDFKRVVGISWYMWLFVIFFLLLNINGWHTYFWLAFLPLFLLLIVGAKLEHIITRLAQEAATSLSHETERAPKLKPSKEHFWFRKPGLVLHLIHFILFQNSFEIGFFFWVLVSEGFGSCMMEEKAYAISRLVIGVIIEVICSYITLPLYAIVTHMSGYIKLEGFGSGLHEAVQIWATDARSEQSWKKTGGDPDTGAGVEVSRAPNQRFGIGSSRSMLTATPPPDLDEIVTVDDGPDRQP
ncbi:MLO-like protein 13 isoform X3 [Phragmites australis]|uniref:MLO-like protein 13 isoform X3 n=1 Tax=Phragmites australis TaxID=29695 RepID=UPI002D7A05E7|nr:MLO-like protein 13 isoform X3 [Phragmites australis]